MKIRLAFLGLAALALPPAARADDVAPTVDNRLWTTAPSAGGLPTAGQFGGFAPVSAVPGGAASSGTLRLVVSYVGASFSGAVPEFAVGDVIGQPLLTFQDAQGRTMGLRREQVRKTEAAFRYRVAGNPAIQTFDPAVGILTERFFWSQHAHFNVVPDVAGVNERPVAAGETGTPRDGFLYANQAGGTRLYWRTEAPVGVDGTSQPVYGLVERAVVVSTASRLPVRRIFWTEQGFAGQPVTVPTGEVQQVRIAFTDAFPDAVPDGTQFVPPSSSTSLSTITTRTLFYENNALRAYNREGRVLVELLAEARSPGLRRQVGVEVVDVVQEAAPALVGVPLGERLYPLPAEQAGQQAYPLPTNGADRLNALARIASNLALYNPSLVLSTGGSGQTFTMQFQLSGALAYYATRETASASDVQVFWREPGLAGIQWPKFLNRDRQFWPDELGDYAVNVRPSDLAQVSGTVPFFGQAAAPELVYQDDPNNLQARLGSGLGFEVQLDSSDPVNRSLLLFRTGNGDDGFLFVRVESVLDQELASNPRYGSYYSATDAGGATLTALVGDRILPPAGASSVAGYIDPTKGDAYDPSAYINPFSAGLATAERGAIIPVNAAPQKAGRANNELGVWWFKRIDPPASLSGRFDPIYWPSYYRRYRLAWPLNATPIVLASNAGSDDLPADVAAGSIYYENNPSRTGYNPNEKHALMLSGRAYALRTELNRPNTSDPYVLVRYVSDADGRPAMRAFRVLRENETYTSTYDAKAGTLLQPPMPLAVMPPPLLANGTSRNAEVTPVNLDPPSNGGVPPLLPGLHLRGSQGTQVDLPRPAQSRRRSAGHRDEVLLRHARRLRLPQ